jgi:hypothetical protein
VDPGCGCEFGDALDGRVGEPREDGAELCKIRTAVHCAGISDGERRGRSGNCWPPPTVQSRDLGMTSELGHLLRELRHEATLCNEERIRRIQLDRWIGYPRAEVILARMSEPLAYRHTLLTTACRPC